MIHGANDFGVSPRGRGSLLDLYAELLFSGVDVFISGRMIVNNVTSSNEMFINLEGGSTFQITTSGFLAILAPTVIQAVGTYDYEGSDSNVTNLGEISIVNVGALLTTLSVLGAEFVQNSPGNP